MIIYTLIKILTFVYVVPWTAKVYAISNDELYDYEFEDIKNLPHLLPIHFITLRLPDYCPKMKSCRDGVHIVCVFDPFYADRLGPRCDGGRNITLMESNKNRILSLMNHIRGRVATGIETGKDNITLYRAYNMPQLDWDNHLAAFAQILANQCIFKHDMCRATYKFSDPGQAIGMLRFTYPDWQMIGSKHKGKKFEKFDDQVRYTIHQVIKRWYLQKNNVTNEMISKNPTGSRRQFLKELSGSALYLQMVSGKTTHVGCGISAYTDYVRMNNGQFYNVIHLVCNFSHKLLLNEFVYNIFKVHDGECGCEKGLQPSTDCLCHPIKGRQVPGMEDAASPTVHILPIIVSGNDSDERLVMDQVNQGRASHRKAMENENMEVPLGQIHPSETFFDPPCSHNNYNNARTLNYDLDFETADYKDDFDDFSSVDYFYMTQKDLGKYIADGNIDIHTVHDNNFAQNDFLLKQRPVRRQ